VNQKVGREQLLAEFQQTLATVAHPQSLYASVLRSLDELFHPAGLALVLYEADWNVFRPAASRGFSSEAVSRLELQPSDRLVSWLKVNRLPLQVDETSGIFRYLSQEEQRMLLDLGVEVCLPLVSMNRIIGLLLVGRRRERDLSLLAALAAQAALAIENALLNQQQTERLRQMYRAERLATAGQLASGVAHEIRNPLTAIRSTIQFLAGDAHAGEGRRELLEGVVAEVDRINQIITQLLSFSRSAEAALEPLELNPLVQFSLSLVAAQARLEQVRVVCQLAPLPTIAGDEGQLKQLFLNLLLNALQAMPEGGELRVESAAGPGGAACLSIADTGCGMSEEVLERIFDPFFTTKAEGTGLGLALSYAIVERHRGEIRVRSAPGEGTVVMLKFPAYVARSDRG
jgi:signal transduction histidine kinase